MRINFFLLLTICIFVHNFLFGIDPVGRFNKEDIIEYGNSNAEFKKTFLLTNCLSQFCGINAIKLSEEDPIDFYVTAAHCVEDGLDLSELSFESLVEQFPEMLEKEFIGKDFSKEELCKGVLDYNVYKSELTRNDIIDRTNLACVLHPEWEDYSVDLALCTLYDKKEGLEKYEYYYAEDKEYLKDKQAVHIGFGAGTLIEKNEGVIFDEILNITMLPSRQAANFLIKGYDKILLFLEDSNLEVIISDDSKSPKLGPIGNLQLGDSGGALLIKKDYLKYKIIGVATRGGDLSGWHALTPSFLEEARRLLLEQGNFKR